MRTGSLGENINRSPQYVLTRKAPALRIRDRVYNTCIRSAIKKVNDGPERKAGIDKLQRIERSILYWMSNVRVHCSAAHCAARNHLLRGLQKVNERDHTLYII